MSTSDDRPAPSPLITRASQRSSTFSSTNSAAGSFVGSVKQTAKHAMDADVPLGAWAAAAQSTAKAPTIGDIRNGSFSGNGWTSEVQKDVNEEGRMRRASSGSSGKIPRLRSAAGAGVPQVDSVQEHHEVGSKHAGAEPLPKLTDSQAHSTWTPNAKDNVLSEEEEVLEMKDPLSRTDSSVKEEHALPVTTRNQRVYSTGWRPPPKLPWTKSWAIGLKAFGKWATTLFGFVVTVYCLNVVAWGGMLFLLLCGAAPEMCWAPIGDGEYVRDCNHIDSPRRIWLEIDSQILNGLFCVTGFGLLPWRARDLYFLLRWRFCNEKKEGRQKKLYGLRKLAGFYKGWVRLPGSDTLDTLSLAEYNAQTARDAQFATIDDALTSVEAGEADANDPRLPLPLEKIPSPPLTGIRAPPTKLWKLDFYIWCNMWNTFFQACLCGFMWGMNRYDRPSWSTGFFIACACIISAVGGYVSFKEGKKIKLVEGVNPSPAVAEALEKIQRQKEQQGGLELANTNSTVDFSVRADDKGRAGT
ncbi:hypothetical protein Q7P35_003750 [Cladosporium inversicolor]